LPFYSGAVTYRRTVRARLRRGEHLFVCVPEYRGTVARVLVDGREAGVIGWEPNEVELTGLPDGQSAVLEIEVYSHRRNSHGPLHLKEKDPASVSPGFRSTGDAWTNAYRFVPCGLAAPPRLEWRRRARA
jgi:hypothetical protein